MDKRSDVIYAKTLYGEKSNEFALAKQLGKAKGILVKDDLLVLEKKCKMEIIRIYFYYRPITDKVYLKVKQHHTLDTFELKRKDSSDMDMPLSVFVDSILYDLITKDGYMIYERGTNR